LVSDVQSAFVSNRQILDDPFILNELISWCKNKNTKAMIFKIDFEKAFDLVRWDFLDTIINNFGFGPKWRSWIQGCLNSAMGSILVNGSSISSFKFFKGLKQGDLLSHFLFYLIMESLHLCFYNVVHTGLYNGIHTVDSLSLLHVFYADNVVFVGKWNLSNLSTIVNVLKWVFLASGLKISLYKSKLMGIGISHDVVVSAARSIGCSTFHMPFNYLGVKVPKGVLSKMESTSRDFFNGVENSDKTDEVWLADSPLKQVYPRLYLLEADKQSSVATKLSDPSLTASFRRPIRGGIEEEQLHLLVASTSSIILHNISDRWIWKLDSSGAFSVKSARNFIDDSFLPKMDVPTRWVKSIPIKINIFAWKVFWTSFPRGNLLENGVNLPLPILNQPQTSHYSPVLGREEGKTHWSKYMGLGIMASSIKASKEHLDVVKSLMAFKPNLEPLFVLSS
ncbi:RNA-directed DNA polymerase, eukaryota, partial [Tanacetum coccineum]